MVLTNYANDVHATVRALEIRRATCIFSSSKENTDITALNECQKRGQKFVLYWYGRFIMSAKC